MYLKNCCTISYVLLSFWTTCQIKPNFLTDIQKIGGIYEDISKLINMINEGAWANAKYFWITSFLNKEPTISDAKQIVFDCRGKLNDFFSQTF